jgi:hypothetical protein
MKPTWSTLKTYKVHLGNMIMPTYLSPPLFYKAISN